MSWFRSSSPAQVLEEGRKAYNAGQYQQVIARAQPMAVTTGELQGDLAALVAQAYAKSGNADQALVYLRIALGTGAMQPAQAMLDPAFESLRTDLRFVSLLAGAQPATGVTASVVSVSSGDASPPVQSAPGVAAQVGPGGASASAGGVSARVAP